MSMERRKINVPLGTFPFPLTDGPQESPYLTWLRNHSNYWAVRGFLDYLRFVSVLVRGIVVNFLIFLPALLVIALVLAFLHHWMLANPFCLTLVVLGLAIGWILLFPIRTQLLQIFKYKRSVETGSESTVTQRDNYERSFSRFLLAIFAMAFFESLPWVVEWFHDLLQQEKLSWQGGLATVATAVAVLSGSDKLLSLLSGAKKKLVALLIGILGLLVPLLVIIFATEFLVYGTPLSPLVMLVPLAVSGVGAIPIAIAIVVGLGRGIFNWKDSMWVSRQLVLGSMVLAAIYIGGLWVSSETNDTFGRFELTIRPVREIASQFHKIANQQTLAPEVTRLLGQAFIAHREFERNTAAIEEANKLLKRPETSSQSVAGDNWTLFPWSPDLGTKWEEHKRFAEWKGQYFSSGEPFITLASRLSAQSEENLSPLRREIANLAYSELKKNVCNSYAVRCGPASWPRCARTDSPLSCRCGMTWRGKPSSS